MLKIPRPVFESVTICALLLVKTTWVGNVSVVGERATAGSTPTPVRETVWGLLGALSVMLRAAVRAPTVVGVNDTVIVQVPPAARDDGQRFCWEKSPLFAPVIAIEEMINAILPVLVRFTRTP